MSVQWLALRAFTARAQVQSLVKELRSCRTCNREVDDAKRCCGPLPDGVKEDCPVELENGDSDAKTLGVLGSMAFE